MCTLTWSLKQDYYEIFFNRDERKQRQLAIPPQYSADKKSIMPIDPDGSGTWIGVNQMAYSFCLLNNYQADAIHHPEPEAGESFHSRGLLIPELLELNSFEDICDCLEEKPLRLFRPFLLAIFAPELIFSEQPEVAVFSWNGEQAGFIAIEQPIISTSVAFAQASKNRTQNYLQLIAKSPADAITQHFKFHRSHAPEKGPLSVCMHRDDASTVSFSHIQVKQKICFSYQKGALCENHPNTEILMDNYHSLFGS